MILCPPNLPKWRNVPIVRALTRALGVPAFLENGANACALAEWRLGAGKMKEIADVNIAVPEGETFRVQELHLPIYHRLCLLLESHFFPEEG